MSGPSGNFDLDRPADRRPWAVREERDVAQDKHVTSKAILATGDQLVKTVKPDILSLKGEIPTTSVPFPSFGLIGMGFQIAHTRVQDYATDYLQAAADRLDVYAANLVEVAAAWQRAEDANTVQVR
jgi:hypothetical protein